MKKFIKNISKVIVLLIAICIMLAKPINADVGYHSSYSGGSSSHSSSSHSRSSSSHSSSGSSHSSSSSSSSDADPFAGFIVVLIFIGIMIYVTKKNGKLGTQNVNLKNILVQDNTSSVEAKIREIDPMFSAENFMAYSREVFVKLQTAWMEKKWEEIRPFESNELFEQHRQQLQYLIDNNQTNMMEKICVRYTCLNSFRQDGDKEIITMTLKSAMKDYTIDDKTKNVVQGNKNEDVYMVYTLTFMRKAGVKTKEGIEKTSTTNCPNCGAPTKITSSGKCEYCGSIITTGEHGWVLSGLEGSRGM